MAGKKKTKVTVKRSGKVVDLTKGRIVVADYELRKAFDKLRKDFAGLVGEVARVDADMKRGVEVAKVAKGTVTKLMRDPLVSVPQDLAKKVLTLEEEVKRLKVKLADRALVTTLDTVVSKVMDFEKELEGVCTTVAAHDDRLDDLDEAVTSPKEHAHPPDHPAPTVDPRQTTLDDAIAKAKKDGGADDAEETNEHDEDDDARADEAGGAPT